MASTITAATLTVKLDSFFLLRLLPEFTSITVNPSFSSISKKEPFFKFNFL